MAETLVNRKIKPRYSYSYCGEGSIVKTQNEKGVSSVNYF